MYYKKEKLQELVAEALELASYEAEAHGDLDFKSLASLRADYISDLVFSEYEDDEIKEYVKNYYPNLINSECPRLAHEALEQLFRE
jgi:hypothetical protein